MKISPNSLSYLTVNLEGVVENYQKIQNFIGNRSLSAVVKANAYGIGAVEVAKALFNHGCFEFYVSSIDEAIDLRQNLPSAIIYVLHGVNKGEEYYFLEHKIIPVLNSLEQLNLWNNLAKNLNVHLPANLFFDTYMYRLGFANKDYQSIKNCLSENNLDIRYIMSHLSCADNKTHPQNQKQLKAFKEIIKEFPGYKTSFCNSDGIFLGKEFQEFDQVRLGIGLYGLATHSKELDLKHVLQLHSEIIQLRDITEEGQIGYSATENVKSSMKVAVVAIGYADGYFLRSGKNLPVWIAGQKVNMIGLTSMDLVTVDVSGIPEKKLSVGQEVEIFGENISIETVAKMADTIKYGILTSLGTRIKKKYVTN